MDFVDWSISIRNSTIYLAICINIPSMALYIAEIVTIVRHKKFHNSFYALFVMRAIPDLLYVLNSFYAQRLPFHNWLPALPNLFKVPKLDARNDIVPCRAHISSE
ncbi:hypothetical protein GPALN_004886 [Globodera pallida]|nr:hypothetical protein GPALN_004886 [Globodera pallida]